MACRSQLTLSLLACATVGATPVFGAIFGSNNDGLGGFTTSPVDAPQESWTTLTESVRYINDDADGPGGSDGATRNSSLFGEFASIDRSVGNTYTATGVITMTAGYADDNNRLGIYLFSDTAVIPGSSEDGALALLFNVDDGFTGGSPGNNDDDRIAFFTGVNGENVSGYTNRNEGSTPFAQDLFGTTVTLSAEMTFRAGLAAEEVFLADGDTTTTLAGGEVVIDVVGRLTDADNNVTTTSVVSVLASEFTGDYFGFANRARNRGADGKDIPWTMDYESFSIVPEPSSLGLLGLGGLCVLRRRRG